MGIDVAMYLSHLLYRNNVAIIPGFGAFVAANTPAVIDQARGILHPPTKILTFNENLKINDGFLINLIRHKHGITAHEARIIVENFVKSLNDILHQNDTIRLENIGKLYFNGSKSNVIFEPDTRANFNVTTFGLPQLQYYTLPRKDTLVKPAQNPVTIPTAIVSEDAITPNQQTDNTNTTATPASQTPVTEHKKSKTFVTGESRALMAAASAGLVIMAAFWLYRRPNNTAVHEGKVVPTEARTNVKPSHVETKSDIATLDSISQYTDAIVAQEAVKKKQEAKAKEKKQKKRKKPRKQDKSTTNNTIISKSAKEFSTTYYIGSFSNTANINRVERKLHRRGFKPLRQAYNDLTRIGTIINYDNEAEKDKAIEKLRKAFGTSIWEAK